MNFCIWNLFERLHRLQSASYSSSNPRGFESFSFSLRPQEEKFIFHAIALPSPKARWNACFLRREKKSEKVFRIMMNLSLATIISTCVYRLTMFPATALWFKRYCIAECTGHRFTGWLNWIVNRHTLFGRLPRDMMMAASTWRCRRRHNSLPSLSH